MSCLVTHDPSRYQPVIGLTKSIMMIENGLAVCHCSHNRKTDDIVDGAANKSINFVYVQNLIKCSILKFVKT